MFVVAFVSDYEECSTIYTIWWELLHDTLKTSWHAHFNRSGSFMVCNISLFGLTPMSVVVFVQFLRTIIGFHPFYSHVDHCANDLNREGAKKNSLCTFAGYCSFPKSKVIWLLLITWLHSSFAGLLCGQGLFFFHLFILFCDEKAFYFFLSFSAFLFISFCCERTLSKQQKVDAGGDFAEEMREEKWVRVPLPGGKQNQHQCGHLVKLQKNVKIREGGVVPPKR